MKVSQVRTKKQQQQEAREEQERQAVAYLQDRPGAATSDVGEHLWPKHMGRANAPHARSAGKLLKRLEKAGLVRRENPPDRGTTFWYAVK